MACGVNGGYYKVVYGTSVGMTTSTEITGLLNGTLIQEGETTTIQDATGNDLHTGFRQRTEIHTSLVSGSVITGLQTAATNCTKLWFRFYATGAHYFKVGGTLGNTITIAFAGAEAGGKHRHIIRTSAFVEDPGDIITVEA